MFEKLWNKKFIISFLMIIGIIIIVFLYLKVQIIEEIINLIVISGIIAYVLKPLRNILVNKFNLSKKIASISIILSLTLIIAIFIVVSIPNIIEEVGDINEIFEKFNLYFKEFEEGLKLSNNAVINTIYIQGSEKVWSFLSSISYKSFDFILELSKNILSYIIIPVIAYYFLSDGEKISNSFYLIIPMKSRGVIKNILKDIDVLLQRYIISQLALCLITTVLSFITFCILGIKFPLMLALINGIFNIVPYFGAILGGIPAVFLALIQSPTLAIWTIIGILIVQQIEGNLIAPKITADSTDLHPMLIIILLILGEKLGGIIGMIFIIPIAVSLKVLYDDINYYIF
ncbi:AI-2E family transporter [uncultured Clostridium sp.]|uniref:AI-2E family transporter n=1 Tax=uncultured Clostridium sp. TaxID=59620 RepID=UPI0026075085|nr:AI-2E family transporter [uncultured Clostridium sp.]